MNDQKQIGAKKTFEYQKFYISISLDELKFILNDIHTLVNNKKSQLEETYYDSVDKAKRETAEHQLYFYQNQPKVFLNEGAFLSLIILLENEIDTYCKNFKQHYNLTIGYKDLKGDLLGKFKTFTSKLLHSDFNFQGVLWQNIVGLYEIRNSLVYNKGLVSEFGKKKTIENFVSRNDAFVIEDNEYICISHEACVESIKIVETFLNEIMDFALRSFPDEHQSNDIEKYDF